MASISSGLCMMKTTNLSGSFPDYFDDFSMDWFKIGKKKTRRNDNNSYTLISSRAWLITIWYWVLSTPGQDREWSLLSWCSKTTSGQFLVVRALITVRIPGCQCGSEFWAPLGNFCPENWWLSGCHWLGLGFSEKRQRILGKGALCILMEKFILDMPKFWQVSQQLCNWL